MKFPNLQNNVRNPLGVIAMFVSFAYVSMVVSFTIGIDKLNGASERLPIIWFLILFPLIIFIAFILLIIFCNEKLFGPLDYRDDSSFIFLWQRIYGAA
jgi:type IV secretory pathway VirB2 component (pilin)